MRDKVTRQCPQTTNLFQEKGEPQRNRAEVLVLTSLTPYRWAKPAHDDGDDGDDRYYTALFSVLSTDSLRFCRLTVAFNSAF